MYEKYIAELKADKVHELISIENYDYIVFVYWNRFMGRQSKRLIHFVQENYKLAKDFNVKIIYVNTDNVFASFN